MSESSTVLFPSSRRLRLGRHSQLSGVYLVTINCHGRLPWFHDPRKGRCVVHALKAVSDSAETLCFMIMPDHLHWLMRMQRGELSPTVQKMKSLSVKCLRRQFQIDAPIWQRGFHDKAVRRHESLRALAVYVLRNPLRAGLVKSLEEYSLWDSQWSMEEDFH